MRFPPSAVPARASDPRMKGEAFRLRIDGFKVFPKREIDAIYVPA
jgi:hypothetical protein